VNLNSHNLRKIFQFQLYYLSCYKSLACLQSSIKYFTIHHGKNTMEYLRSHTFIQRTWKYGTVFNTTEIITCCRGKINIKYFCHILPIQTQSMVRSLPVPVAARSNVILSSWPNLVNDSLLRSSDKNYLSLT
jgi:hypothetical protein